MHVFTEVSVNVKIFINFQVSKSPDSNVSEGFIYKTSAAGSTENIINYIGLWTRLICGFKKKFQKNTDKKKKSDFDIQ